MHIKKMDLNLLRLFDAVFLERNVSRAAERLQLTQPAASQGLTRLRLLLKDALFVRASGGVAPTLRAERMAPIVQAALALLEDAVADAAQFVPAASRKVFRLHVSDIGEVRLLPGLMAALHAQAPGVTVETVLLPHAEISAALDAGRIDVAFGFLPSVTDTRRRELLKDRYAVLLRKDHPFVRGRRQLTRLEDLQQLEFAAVRAHSDTLRILQLLRLESRLRLTGTHFLSLPHVVKATQLGLLIPRSIARDFVSQGGCTLIEPHLPLRDFSVALHWSQRFDADPAQRWLRGLILGLFGMR